jgi:hypothetical protein
MRYLLFLLLIAACRAPGEVITSPLVGAVKTRLDSTRANAPRLVLRDEPTTLSGAPAVCYDNHIAIMGKGQGGAFHFCLAHELVHWYTNDSPYEGLPVFIEEGLADWIACDLTGGLNSRIAENEQIGTLSIDPRHLWLDNAEFIQLPRDETADLGRAGFEIVRRLGLPRLRELLQDDAEPLDYLRAAGMILRD